MHNIKIAVALYVPIQILFVLLASAVYSPVVFSEEWVLPVLLMKVEVGRQAGKFLFLTYEDIFLLSEA